MSIEKVLKIQTIRKILFQYIFPTKQALNILDFCAI